MDIKAVRHEIVSIGRLLKGGMIKNSWVFLLDGKEHKTVLFVSQWTGRIRILSDDITIWDSPNCMNAYSCFCFKSQGIKISLERTDRDFFEFELYVEDRAFDSLELDSNVSSELILDMTDSKGLASVPAFPKRNTHVSTLFIPTADIPEEKIPIFKETNGTSLLHAASHKEGSRMSSLEFGCKKVKDSDDFADFSQRSDEIFGELKGIVKSKNDSPIKFMQSDFFMKSDPQIATPFDNIQSPMPQRFDLTATVPIMSLRNIATRNSGIGSKLNLRQSSKIQSSDKNKIGSISSQHDMKNLKIFGKCGEIIMEDPQLITFSHNGLRSLLAPEKISNFSFLNENDDADSSVKLFEDQNCRYLGLDQELEDQMPFNDDLGPMAIKEMPVTYPNGFFDLKMDVSSPDHLSEIEKLSLMKGMSIKEKQTDLNDLGILSEPNSSGFIQKNNSFTGINIHPVSQFPLNQQTSIEPEKDKDSNQTSIKMKDPDSLKIYPTKQSTDLFLLSSQLPSEANKKRGSFSPDSKLLKEVSSVPKTKSRSPQATQDSIGTAYLGNSTSNPSTLTTIQSPPRPSKLFMTTSENCLDQFEESKHMIEQLKALTTKPRLMKIRSVQTSVMDSQNLLECLSNKWKKFVPLITSDEDDDYSIIREMYD